MNLLGSEVIHNIYGKGVINLSADSVITVRFENEERKFVFPDSFSGFLTFADTEKQSYVDKILCKLNLELLEESLRVQEEKKRLIRLRTLKITPKSQGVFGLVENSAKEVFASWSARSGTVLSGYSKGKPRVPSALAPNSACIFTELPPGCEEKERKVIGAFMVHEDFDGRLCTDGIIKAHDKFRIKLEDGETPPFWDYMNLDSLPLSWGGVEIRYCTNLIVKKILYDLIELIEEPVRKKQAEWLYRYYCTVNRLPESPENNT